MTPHQRKIATIVSKLWEWFRSNARDLPWRRTTDPYAIWVSEIMLQQTQVKTVLPYWERWMRTLPTIESLAEQKVERLHKLWEGLGYYSRVRNMHRAAQIIVRQHHGRFPEDFDQILALPGVGPYTAGAVASIAFNQPKPILDGNVIRVLSRCFGITGNARTQETSTQLWQIASDLVSAVPNAGPGIERSFSRFNQALMELGALVCLPRQPQCGGCPLRRNCFALRRGCVEKLPNLGRRTPMSSRSFVAVVLERNGRFFVRQRPAGIVNGQLWEFPNSELNGRDSTPSEWHGCDLGNLEPLCTIRHSITRYRITLQVLRSRAGQASPGIRSSRRIPLSGFASRGGTWLPLSQLDALPFTSAHRKILTVLRRSKS